MIEVQCYRYPDRATATEHGCRLINATERAFFQLTVSSSCEHVLESKKATDNDETFTSQPYVPTPRR